MPDSIDRFLGHRSMIPFHTPLGRVYGVTRQSWSLDADPTLTRPESVVIATARSAGEAADIARNEAIVLTQHGFHKPSGAWWGVRDGRFHRFVVAARPRRKTVLAVAAGVAGLGIIALARGRMKPRG